MHSSVFWEYIVVLLAGRSEGRQVGREELEGNKVGIVEYEERKA